MQQSRLPDIFGDPRGRLTFAVLLVITTVSLGVAIWAGEPKGLYTHAQILDAIRMVESSGNPNPPDGDDGLAIGPYQIHRRYWEDSELPGSYQDCRRRQYAERVVEAYMRRWVPQEWQWRDAEVIARIHNGGPRGMHKMATDGYWRRVEEQLERR